MTLAIGSSVRTLVDLLTEDGSIIPIGSKGVVVRLRDQQLVVDFTGDFAGLTAVCSAWEVWRIPG